MQEEEEEEEERRRRTVGECSSIIISIVLLNFRQNSERQREGTTERRDYVTSYQEENPRHKRVKPLKNF